MELLRSWSYATENYISEGEGVGKKRIFKIIQ